MYGAVLPESSDALCDTVCSRRWNIVVVGVLVGRVPMLSRRVPPIVFAETKPAKPVVVVMLC